MYLYQFNQAEWLFLLHSNVSTSDTGLAPLLFIMRMVKNPHLFSYMYALINCLSQRILGRFLLLNEIDTFHHIVQVF